MSLGVWISPHYIRGTELLTQGTQMAKSRARLDRQFDRIARKIPQSAGLLTHLRRPGARWFRIPLAILLILGGIFSFLPVLGIWMLPLGLLLLALDLAFLQGPVNTAIVQGLRKWSVWRRARRDKKAAKR
jgi:hypothetical protein